MVLNFFFFSTDMQTKVIGNLAVTVMIYAVCTANESFSEIIAREKIRPWTIQDTLESTGAYVLKFFGKVKQYKVQKEVIDNNKKLVIYTVTDGTGKIIDNVYKLVYN